MTVPPLLGTPQDATALVQLASAAMSDLSGGVPLPPPVGWSPLQTVPATVYPPSTRGTGAQGYYAVGTFQTTAQQQVAVLALGFPWIAYLNANPSGIPGLGPPPGGVVPAPGGQVVAPYASAYQAIRGRIWSALSSVAGLPLVVVGMGLGGPIAQLAALDLRPGNTGPNKETAPAAQPSCYVFSSPPPGDATFATTFAATVGTSFTTGLGLSVTGMPVDTFPAVSGIANAVAAGATVQSLPALLPAPFDDPWMERAPGAYIAALGGTVPAQAPNPPGLSSMPSGFDASLAASLAMLCAATYGLARSPAQRHALPLAPFVPAGVIRNNGTVLASVYTFAGGAVVAFRGAASFAEFTGALGSSGTSNANFLSASYGSVHAGALALYLGASDGGTTVQAALQAVLSTAGANKVPLYFAGHDVGGAIAVIAAADIAKNVGSLAKPVVYTFGGCPVGNADFVSRTFAPLGIPLFAITRPGDFLPPAFLTGNFSPAGTAISLTGSLPNDEPTVHALTGYQALLDPWAPLP